MRPPEPMDFEEAGGDKNNNPLGYVERIIYVRTCRVGYLIGTAGRTIRGFENNSGAKIDILTPNSCNNETPVLLSGPHECVRNVLRQITDLYHKNNLSSILFQHVWKDHGDTEENGGKKILGHEELIVQSTVVTQLQALIPSIEKELKVHVDVGKESEDQPGIVALGFVGTAVNIHSAVERITEAIAKAAEDGKTDSEESSDYSSYYSDTDSDEDGDDDDIEILEPPSPERFYKELVFVPNPIDYNVLLSARKKNDVKLEMLYLKMEGYDIAISGSTVDSVVNAKFQLLNNKI